jgi:hypothetical protein
MWPMSQPMPMAHVYDYHVLKGWLGKDALAQLDARLDGCFNGAFVQFSIQETDLDFGALPEPLRGALLGLAPDAAHVWVHYWW